MQIPTHAPRFRRSHPLAVACCAALLSVSAARADGTRWDGNAEVSGYYDTDAVMVITPALQAAAKTESGWSASGGHLVDVVTATSADILSTPSPR
ncbi:MAG TPA: hypothetical protein PKA88_27970, partial [Polyangiaceae bacterium]|nr:hypothetical protein [Polyangiaceae bacterium]